MPHQPCKRRLVEFPCPPAPTVPRIPICRPQAGQTLSGIALSDSVAGFWVHYRDQCSLPCTGRSCSCPGCIQGMPKRWRGYLIALQQPQHKLILLELTPCAFRNAVGVPTLSHGLRGRCVTLFRQRTSTRGMVHCKVSETKVHYVLPDCPDLAAVLGRIWGIEELTTDLPQPVNLRLPDPDMDDLN